MRFFVRQPIKGSRCTAFDQHFKSNKAGNVFEIISKEVNIRGKNCQIEAYIKFISDIRKQIEKQYDSNFDDYCNINSKDKNNFIIQELS